MKLFLKIEWRKNGRVLAWTTGGEVPHVGALPISWPRGIMAPSMSEASAGEFQSLLNRQKERDTGAGGKHVYAVYDVVEFVGNFVIVETSPKVREMVPGHYRVVSLLNASESTVEKHGQCHEIIRAARTSGLRGSFGLDERP